MLNAKHIPSLKSILTMFKLAFLILKVAILVHPTWCSISMSRYELKSNILTQSQWESYVVKDAKGARSHIECASICSQMDHSEETRKCNAYAFDQETKSCHLANVTGTESSRITHPWESPVCQFPTSEAKKIHLEMRKYQDDHCQPPYQKVDDEMVCLDNECSVRGLDECSECPQKYSGNVVITSGYPPSTLVEAYRLTCCSQSFGQSKIDGVVISLRECTIPQFPNIRGLDVIGAVVGSKILVCGGREAIVASTESDECFSLEPHDNQWQLAGKMLTKRCNAAAVDFDGKLFIAGGRHTDNSIHLDSTEIVDLSSGFTTIYGPKLPHSLALHCMVKLNSTTAMIIGGFDGATDVSSTYYFDFPSLTFTPGPNLQLKRKWMGCGILQNGQSGYVIVAGGESGSLYLASSEYLSLQSPVTWHSGPSFPLGYSRFRMVSGANYVLAFGGYDSAVRFTTIYKMVCLDESSTLDLSCAWVKLDTELREAKDNPLPLLVPENFVKCTF